MKYYVPISLFLIVLLAGITSYFIGRSSVAGNRSATSENTRSPEKQVISPTPSPIPSAGKKIEAGGILSFPKYEITIPDDWDSTRESQTKDDEKLTLKSKGYEISILEGGFGGGICLYPGDQDVEGPSSRYDNFKEIKTLSDDTFRRGWNGKELESVGFSVCQLTQYGWGAPTLYGHISLKTPGSPDPAMLAVIDSILSSIKKR